MSSNVIDELVVLVKVDGKPAKKGLDDQVAAVESAKKRINVSAEDQQRIDNSRAQRTKDREQKQEKERKDRDRARARSTQELGDKVKDVAFSIGGAVLGFESLKGAFNFLGNLSTATAKLGRDSQNLGLSAVGLQTWGNAIERAGGNAADAQASFAALSQQYTAFKLRGEVGPLLTAAQNNGVYTRDANGASKPLDQLLPEIVDAVLKRYSRADAYNLLSSAGVSEGLFNLLADPNRKKYLADGKERAFATKTAIDRAQAAGAIRAGVGQAVKADVSGAIDSATLFFADSQEHSHDFKGGIFGEAIDYYKNLFGEKGATVGVRNNNPGNLEDRHGQFRKFSSMIKGESALSSDIDTKIDRDGLNSIRQIISKYAPKADHNDTDAYIADVSKRLGIDADDPLTSREQRAQLVDAIVHHEQGKAGYAQVTRAISTPGAAAGGGNTTHGDTTLHVETIHVNAPNAKDATGVANGIVGALDTRLSSQTNVGMTP